MTSKLGNQTRYRFALGAIAAVLFLLYWQCIHIPPAGDDWLLIHPAQELVRKHGVVTALFYTFVTPIYDFYRPIALVPSVFFLHDFAVFQSLKLIVIAAFSWLIFRTAIGIGMRKEWALLAAAVVVLHQVFVSVTTEIDLWGDLIPAVVFIGLIDLCRRYVEHDVGTIRLCLTTLALTAVCLLSKEAGVISFLIPLLFALVRPIDLDDRRRSGLFRAAFGSFLVAIGYMYVRFLLELPTSGQSGYYQLGFGFNLITNLGLALLALMSPVNSIEIALGAGYWKVVAALFVLAIGGSALYGITKHGSATKVRWAILLLLITFISQGPVFLMPHLTEANFVRSLAPGWLAVLLGLQTIYDEKTHRLVRRGIIGIFVAWFVLDLSAVYSKRAEIVEDQNRLARFRHELTTIFDKDIADTLYIAVVDPGYKGYSVYRQPLLQELQLGDVPFGVFESFQPRNVQSILQVVDGKQAAILSEADCIVTDDGHVERLIASKIELGD